MNSSPGALRGQAARRCVAAAASLAILMNGAVAPSPALTADKSVDFCEAQRAPIAARAKEYKDLKESKLFKAVGAGLKQGMIVLVTGAVSSAVAKFTGRQPPPTTKPQGQRPNSPGAFSGMSPDAFNDILAAKVPGIDNRTGASANGNSDQQMKAWATLAIFVAIAGTVDAFVKLKEEEAAGDLRKASLAIDQDAGRQLTVSRQMASETAALATCRQQQIADLNAKLASATNEKDRKGLRRDRTKVAEALEHDIDATNDVVVEQTKMAKTFTQGRAMTEGVSEAVVLGGQAPAYETTSLTEKRAMPPPEAGARPPPPAPRPMFTVRATAVRSAPQAGASIVMNFPAKREVKPKGRAATDSAWWEIDIAGQPGFVRGVDLGEAGAVPAGKGGKGTKSPPKPPALAAPTNIRAHNQSVIAAREGSGRLKSLLTDIQEG